jgi:hypothetical protein
MRTRPRLANSAAAASSGSPEANVTGASFMAGEHCK